MMSQFICTLCGYLHENDAPPAFCPQCKAAQNKFKAMKRDGLNWADEHRIGIADGVDFDIMNDLRSSFLEECTEVGMYEAMARQADREGYPEISGMYHRISLEEAEHAGKLAEILGEIVFNNTKKNLELRYESAYESCRNKKKLANKAKQMGLDAIHDTLHEMCKDEARHGCMFGGVLERYFSKSEEKDKDKVKV